jgi:hypothetical protein
VSQPLKGMMIPNTNDGANDGAAGDPVIVGEEKS